MIWVILGVWLAGSAFCFWMLYRNAVTFRITMRALDLVSEESRRRFDLGDYESWRELYGRLETPSYDRILWDFRIWTATDAYPWLTEIEAEQEGVAR